MTKARDIADGKFENGTVSQGSSGVTRYSEMWVEDDDHSELTFATPNNKQGRINFSDPDANNQGRFVYDHADNSLAIHTNGSENMVIDSSGNVGIGTGATDPAHPLTVQALSGRRLSVGDAGSAITKMQVTNDAETGYGFFQIKSYDMRFMPNGTEHMRLDSNGRLLISKTTNAEATVGIRFDGSSSGQGRGFFTANNNYLLSLRRNSGNGSMIIFKRDATTVGSISATTSQTNYNTTSDHRLKENVEDMTGAITRVKQLQPRRFSWVVDDLDAANIDGFLAHEAQSVVPEAVTGTHNETRAVTNAVLSADGILLDEDISQADWTANKGDADDDEYPSDSTWTASHTENVYQGIDQAKLVPLLTGALQEAIAKIEALEARVDALENA